MTTYKALETFQEGLVRIKLQHVILELFGAASILASRSLHMRQVDTQVVE
jgi:hypothetical protein